MKTAFLRAGSLALCLALAATTNAQAASAGQAAASAAVPDLTAEQWRKDLRFMVAEMQRRHANLYHTVSRQQFEGAVADLHARIPTLQRNEIIVGMMRIAAMIGDGHTRVEPRKDANFRFPSLPLKLYLFEDGLFVRAAKPAHAGLVGAQIVAIGGVPVNEAIRRAAGISSVDNASGTKLFAPLFLNMPDILHALKLSASRQAANLTLRKGDRSWDVTVPAGEVEPLWPADTDVSLVTPAGWVDGGINRRLPLWLQKPLDYHRLIEMPERKAIYVQLNMVAGIEGQSLEQFGERIGARAKALNPRAIVLDLRLNQGGNGTLRNQFIPHLIKAEDADTRLYVLTWRGTFSASQFILDDLDRLSDATFIGEPASSKPSSFGDSYKTPMPNSQISVRSSIYWWQEDQNMEPWTFVDVATPLRYSDYVAGRDPALEIALANRPLPSLHDKLVAVAKGGGSDAVLRVLEAHRADPRNRYSNLSTEMAKTAEQLWGADQREESLLVAAKGAEWYPKSVDAQLVYAYLAEAAGKLGDAKAAGLRTLAIDPNSRMARALLQRMK